MVADSLIRLCADCGVKDGTLDIRKRFLCSDCFSRYVNSKILKRMESYRFKNLSGDQKKKLFLPLSGGVSSLVLLQVLDVQLQKQILNRNRTAYDLIIVHVDTLKDCDRETYSKVAARFPSHTFLPIMNLQDVFSLDDSIEADLSYLHVQRKQNESDTELVTRILQSTTSQTALSDMQDILLQRLLVAMAKQHNCESIVWAHSDSRLAALTLSNVSKGRGGSVPSTISDGPSPYGINFNYPVRDIFKTELELYARILPSPLTTLLWEVEDSTKSSVSLRNTSISDLLTNYIQSQGEKYPSIMANVVRTAGKLQVETRDSHTLGCAICMTTLSSEISPGTSEKLCYGCQRLKQDMKFDE